MLCCLNIKQIGGPVAFQLQHSMRHSICSGMTVHVMHRVCHVYNLLHCNLARVIDNILASHVSSPRSHLTDWQITIA